MPSTTATTTTTTTTTTTLLGQLFIRANNKQPNPSNLRNTMQSYASGNMKYRSAILM